MRKCCVVFFVSSSQYYVCACACVSVYREERERDLCVRVCRAMNADDDRAFERRTAEDQKANAARVRASRVNALERGAGFLLWPSQSADASSSSSIIARLCAREPKAPNRTL